MSDIAIEKTGHIALVEIRRPPHNFFDIPLIKEIAAAFESFDEDGDIRAIVLASQGKSFCAGANSGAFRRDIYRIRCAEIPFRLGACATLRRTPIVTSRF